MPAAPDDLFHRLTPKADPSTATCLTCPAFHPKAVRSNDGSLSRVSTPGVPTVGTPKDGDAKQGECRLHPPVLVVKNTTMGSMTGEPRAFAHSLWPAVACDAWCMEHPGRRKP